MKEKQTIIGEDKFPFIRESFDQRDKDPRRKQEKNVFLAMCVQYCKGMKHEGRIKVTAACAFDEELHTFVNRSVRKVELCSECFALVKESVKHTNRCRHLAYKTFCHHCPMPCYTLPVREKIQPIMRYSGPRFILKHPILGTQYFTLTARHAQLIRNYKRKTRQSNPS